MRRLTRLPARALLQPAASTSSITPLTAQCLRRSTPAIRTFTTTTRQNFASSDDATATTTTTTTTAAEAKPKSSFEEKVKGMLLKRDTPAASEGEAKLTGPEWEGYVPAEDGRGLKVVGIRELTEDADEWVVQRYFPEALNVKKASKAVIYSKVRRAVVEEYAASLFPELAPLESVRSTITHAEIPVETVEAITEEAQAEAAGEIAESEVPVYEEVPKAARLVGEQRDYTADVKLERNGSSEIVADFKNEEVVKNILAGRQEVPTEFVDLQDESSVQGPIDFQASWLDAPFANEELKFNIFKRIYQITGLAIPQRDLNTINTPGQAISSLLTPPKPAKLAERILEAEDAPLKELANVKIYNSRLTKVVREKEIGRDHPSLSRKLTREAIYKKKGEEGADELAQLEYVYPYLEKRLPGGDAVRVHTQGGNKWDGKMQIERRE